MELDINMVVLAAGIALAGYFIGNGLRNFGQPNAMERQLDKWETEAYEDTSEPKKKA
ncbi:hypothetical protein [Thalassobacillus hwangdonensis]|uniref:Uncharacterized protein n=1 Tax=Thalassobacillus hwangdonensis TaxID=546108 RepID=A0ABW3L4V9_9BACI